MSWERGKDSQPEPDIEPKTGWPAGLLQDDDRGLSRWLASKPDAPLRAREAAAEIERTKP